MDRRPAGYANDPIVGVTYANDSVYLVSMAWLTGANATRQHAQAARPGAKSRQSGPPRRPGHTLSQASLK